MHPQGLYPGSLSWPGAIGIIGKWVAIVGAMLASVAFSAQPSSAAIVYEDEVTNCAPTVCTSARVKCELNTWLDNGVRWRQTITRSWANIFTDNNIQSIDWDLFAAATVSSTYDSDHVSGINSGDFDDQADAFVGIGQVGPYPPGTATADATARSVATGLMLSESHKSFGSDECP